MSHLDDINIRDELDRIKAAIRDTKPGLMGEWDALRTRPMGALSALLKLHYPGPEWGALHLGRVADNIRAYGEKL